MVRKRLLIIEDDVDVSEMLLAFFANQDYEVFRAEEGAEGIALSLAKFPNLILLDVMLPDMDGFDVCRVLRTTTLTRYIPITFLTQRDSRADRIAGLELGADDYITKPFDVEELRLRVQGSIRRALRDHLHETRTGLPSGPLIQAELDRLIGQKGWSYLYLSVNGFTTFREAYGFLAADEALAFTAQVLAEVVGDLGTLDDFIGTPEEAAFVIFTFTPDIEAFADELHQRFNQRIKTLYNFTDAERGYIIVKSLTGKERHEPFMALTIAQVEPEGF
jgi:DNA-binding response OmpR family regulator